WEGPYLKKDVPRDPWGNPYQYRSPGEHGEYDLSSLGSDGAAGGGGGGAGVAGWGTGGKARGSARFRAGAGSPCWSSSWCSPCWRSSPPLLCPRSGGGRRAFSSARARGAWPPSSARLGSRR